MKTIILFWIIIITLNANPNYKDALFGGVVGVASWDSLNVRAKPNYKAKKVGSLPNDALVGIDRCKKVGKSIWCKVHHIAQRDYEGFGEAKSGWVNARYLIFSDEGYVLINGKGNCDYVLGCQNGYCTLVADSKRDKYNNVISIETKKVKRSSLYSESNFGAAGDGDGYCVEHNYIYDYFRRKKQKSSKSVLDEFLRSVESYDRGEMSYYISQKAGIKISDKPYIDNQKAIPKDTFMRYLEDGTNIIPKYYSGKDVKNPPKIDISSFLHTLYKGKDKISRIDKKVINENEAEYTVYRNLKDMYKYHGMIIRLKKIDSRWYVISIAHKQWGI